LYLTTSLLAISSAEIVSQPWASAGGG